MIIGGKKHYVAHTYDDKNVRNPFKSHMSDDHIRRKRLNIPFRVY